MVGCHNRDQTHKDNCSEPKRRPLAATDIVARNNAARDAYLRAKFIKKTLIFIVLGAILYHGARIVYRSLVASS